MKTAPGFHLYVLAGDEPAGLAATGLEAEPLTDPQQIEQPALVLLRPGQKAPEELAAAAIEVPPDASTAALRELIRMAMENIVLKQQVAQLEAETHRRHRQFRELNRIGIALSAERDIERLQKGRFERPPTRYWRVAGSRRRSPAWRGWRMCRSCRAWCWGQGPMRGRGHGCRLGARAMQSIFASR